MASGVEKVSRTRKVTQLLLRSKLQIHDSDALASIEEVLETNDHDRILSKLKTTILGKQTMSLKSRKEFAMLFINLGKKIRSNETCMHSSNETVFRNILSNTVNGNRIIESRLDQLVYESGDNENAPDYHFNIDLQPVFDESEEAEVNICRDLLKFKRRAKNCLVHPVMQCFLQAKWLKIRKFYNISFIIYLAFIINYSLYLGSLFWRNEITDEVGVQDVDKLLQRQEDIIQDYKDMMVEWLDEDDAEWSQWQVLLEKWEEWHEERFQNNRENARDTTTEPPNTVAITTDLPLTVPSVGGPPPVGRKRKREVLVYEGSGKNIKDKNERIKRNTGGNTDVNVDANTGNGTTDVNSISVLLNNQKNKTSSRAKQIKTIEEKIDGFEYWDSVFEDPPNDTEANHTMEQCVLEIGVFSSTPCTSGFFLIITSSLLLLIEVFKIFTLGPLSYLTDFENYFQLLSVSCALAGIAQQASENYELMKWLSATGISLAYLELIFFMGRSPSLSGQMSLMFYDITKHLIKSLTNFGILTVGFAMGFFVINHGKKKDQFENPFKASIKTFVMVLGEFEFDDLYAAHSDDKYTSAFTLFLFFMMATMGSLVLVNLFVALIVSDVEHLRNEATRQELENKARHVVYFGGILRAVRLYKFLAIPMELNICPHDLCQCKNVRVDSKLMRCIETILKKRKFKAQMEDIRLRTSDAGREKLNSIMEERLVEHDTLLLNDLL